VVWLYASIRPRYGAGRRTAIIAGLAVWFFASLLPFSAGLLIGMYSTSLPLFSIHTILVAVEISVAALAGAWLYK